MPCVHIVQYMGLQSVTKTLVNDRSLLKIIPVETTSQSTEISLV
jgi:hypothetical protein